MEGINQLKTGKLVSLSEQELVDCDVKGQDKGCAGGLMDNAFKFIKHNKDNGIRRLPKNNEKALLQAVANQPVSVAIDFSASDFQFYSSGVYNGTCGTMLNHGVTAVGYGTSGDGTKYWLVKNSYGSGWGDNGYIKMKRDVAAKEGLCGIAMEASYPNLQKQEITQACCCQDNGIRRLPKNNEKALLQAVANQPVSVAIDFSASDFQFYSSGVYNGTCGTMLNHGVTAVGYGTSGDGTKYWLVKNSYGSGWGDNGYIKMKRDVAAKEGLCGIAMEASYPVMD
ncbi:hypothetical protein C3L33_06153, partial [Rhododendron williamsianum]